MSLFRSLLLVIAGSTQRELARQVRYLKTENEILRSKLPPDNRRTQSKSTEDETLLLRDIRCHKRLGRFLKHYERKAA